MLSFLFILSFESCERLDLFGTKEKELTSSSELCFIASYLQGFFIIGQELTISNTSASIKDAVGFFSDNYGSQEIRISSTIPSQTVKIYQFSTLRTNQEVYINTNQKWEGQISYHQKSVDSKAELNIQEMIFFSSSFYTFDLAKEGELYNAVNGQWIDAINYKGNMQLLTVGIEPKLNQDDVLAGTYDVTGKIDIKASTTASPILPSGVYKLDRGIITADLPKVDPLPNYYVKKSGTEIGNKDDPNKNTDGNGLGTGEIAAVVIAVIIVVVVVVFCVVWFVVLKKSCGSSKKTAPESSSPDGKE